MNRLTLFAHYDAETQVKAYILVHLKALKELGGQIHFVSNSPLPTQEIEKVAPFVDRTLLLENRGLDFGMWADALEGLDLSPFDEVLLTSSCVYGPISPLEPTFQWMDSSPCDFWDMTESRQIAPRLHTFSLVFRKQVFSSPAFRKFSQSILPSRSKLHVVHAYELGLTVFQQENGFNCAAAFLNLFRKSSLLQNLLFRKSPLHRPRPKKNPTMLFPDQPLLDGMPYIKTMLFTQNPYRIREKTSLEIRGKYRI